MEPHKAKADELLHTLSCLPYRSDIHQRWKERLDNNANKVLNGDMTITEYRNDVDYVEQYIYSRQHKARARRLLGSLRDLPNMDNYVKESKDKLADLAIQASEANGIEFKKCIDKYKYIVDCIELNLYLEQYKVRADKLLQKIGNHPNMENDVTQWRSSLEQLSIQASKANNIKSKERLVDKYKSHVDCIELNLHLEQYKVIPNRLLQKFSNHPNMENDVIQWRSSLEQLSIQASKANDIKSKERLVDKYKSHVDYIELNLHLEQQRAITHTLLDNLHDILNDNHEYNEYCNRKVELENRIPTNDENNALNNFIKEYTDFIDYIEEKTLYIRMNAQKEKSNILFNNSTYYDKYQIIFKRLEDEVSDNTNDTKFKALCVKEHADYLSQLNDMTRNVRESASTSDSRTQGEIREAECPRPVAASRQELTRADQIPEWHIDLRKGQFSGFARIQNDVKRRVYSNTRSQRLYDIDEIARNINEELTNIQKSLSSSIMTNGNIKQTT